MRATEPIRPDWPAPPTVFALTTTRGLAGHSKPPYDAFNLGARCGDDIHAVAANRERLRALAGLPNPPHWLQQIHGIDVHRVDHLRPGTSEPQADAVVSSVPGAVLAILTADCLPVLFAARDGSEVAAAHAGWRGLSAGVLEATVAAMQTAPENLLAWLGPAAGPAHYEVGKEVRSAFVSYDSETTRCFKSSRTGHWFADLYALARLRLAALGVIHITGGNFCTISDAARFYSHRREGRSGRMASLIYLQNDNG